jgi:hypothetical protein
LSQRWRHDTSGYAPLADVKSQAKSQWTTACRSDALTAATDMAP